MHPSLKLPLKLCPLVDLHETWYSRSWWYPPSLLHILFWISTRDHRYWHFGFIAVNQPFGSKEAMASNFTWLHILKICTDVDLFWGKNGMVASNLTKNNWVLLFCLSDKFLKQIYASGSGHYSSFLIWVKWISRRCLIFKFGQFYMF